MDKKKILTLKPSDEIVEAFSYGFDIYVSITDKIVKMTIPGKKITWKLGDEFPEDVEILMCEDEEAKLRQFLAQK